MREATATLAQSITWSGSKQSYFTARLMVDKDLVDDFFRAYAYFRWADDIIDAPASNDDQTRSNEERISFVKRQRELIDSLYRNERPAQLTAEEEIVAELISHDSGKNNGLQSFIRNMLAVIEFDAKRKGQLISQAELDAYTAYVARSVTDGIHYFIGNDSSHPNTDNRFSATIAAHIAHLLRDMRPDMSNGFINIPREYLEATGIDPEDVESLPFRAWVRERVEQARAYFSEGKEYLDMLEVLRSKIVGHWYCARFEGVLKTIERDDYILRTEYSERRDLSTWFKILWLGISITLKHIAGR